MLKALLLSKKLAPYKGSILFPIRVENNIKEYYTVKLRWLVLVGTVPAS